MSDLLQITAEEMQDKIAEAVRKAVKAERQKAVKAAPTVKGKTVKAEAAPSGDRAPRGYLIVASGDAKKPFRAIWDNVAREARQSLGDYKTRGEARAACLRDFPGRHPYWQAEAVKRQAVKVTTVKASRKASPVKAKAVKAEPVKAEAEPVKAEAS